MSSSGGKKSVQRRCVRFSGIRIPATIADFGTNLQAYYRGSYIASRQAQTRTKLANLPNVRSSSILLALHHCNASLQDPLTLSIHRSICKAMGRKATGSKRRTSSIWSLARYTKSLWRRGLGRIPVPPILQNCCLSSGLSSSKWRWRRSGG